MSVNSEQLCSEAHQSSPQLDLSHQSSLQLETSHQSSPQRGSSLPSACSSPSLHRSADETSGSRTALGDVSCTPAPCDHGAASSQVTPTDTSGHGRQQVAAVSETAVLERRSPAHRLLHAMSRFRRRFVAPISRRLHSRRHSQCCPPSSQQVRPATPVDLPASAASDSDDEDSDDDVINEVEMLGITEGWGPSPAPRVPPGPTDFVSIIEKVKDCGWYWGAISCSTAESILHSEPDGSFIVRDSGDDRYIFSLTFRLRGLIRHVRIEHDNGNFSFGGAHKFRSNTIVDFIENAVEYSRSGRYLFFLHRRPAHGPMRVQLLHPVSRFKHIQSLQHMARFVILRLVRRDHIARLPLPEPLIGYLSSPHYISEQLDQQL